MTIPDDRSEAGGAKGSSDGTDTRGLVQIPESNPTLPSRATVENPYDVLWRYRMNPSPLQFSSEGSASHICAILAGNTFRNDASHNPPCNNTHVTYPSGIEMSRIYSDLIDAVVRRMFEIACTPREPIPLHFKSPSTGGYGRRELAPFSDIDLTLVSQRDGDAQTDRVVRELFCLVTDVAYRKVWIEMKVRTDCFQIARLSITKLQAVCWICVT